MCSRGQEDGDWQVSEFKQLSGRTRVFEGVQKELVHNHEAGVAEVRVATHTQNGRWFKTSTDGVRGANHGLSEACVSLGPAVPTCPLESRGSRIRWPRRHRGESVGHFKRLFAKYGECRSWQLRGRAMRKSMGIKHSVLRAAVSQRVEFNAAIILEF